MEASPKKIKSIKNAEKRRERSKVAARCRRGKESEIFNDLSTSLPILESSKSTLDKASIMRLTLCHLKLKKMMSSAFPANEFIGVDNEDFDSQVNNALGGFILVFTLDGDVIYASEGITTQLGISQYEIMGQSIFDFSHQYDHNDIQNLLTLKKGDKNETSQRSGLFRMKCTVASRGRNAHLRSANYKVINCIGRVMEGKNKSSPEKWFVAICEPLLHPSDVDIPLNKQTFLSKHTPDMKFEYVDDSVSELMGYKPAEMLGKSLFEFHHAEDGVGIGKSFKSLYEKDQNQTERYRFLTKGGGWIWIITQATVIYANNGKTPNSVVCIHFITSGKEQVDKLLSGVQIDVDPECPVELPVSRNVLSEIKINVSLPPPVEITTDVIEKVNLSDLYGESNTFITDLISGPLLNTATCSTSKIFAPKTDDMDSGFLMPVDDTLIISKEEPADLTHLAPIAGDECIPLDVPLLEDLLSSLDEADLAYSYLDPDSDEIPRFGWDGNPLNPYTLDLNQNIPSDKSFLSATSPMFLQSDPPMMNSPDSRSSIFSPYRDRDSRSPSPRSLHSNSEICNSPPPFHQIEEPFAGRLSLTSPLAPELAVLDLLEPTLETPNLQSSSLPPVNKSLVGRLINCHTCPLTTFSEDNEIFWRDKSEQLSISACKFSNVDRDFSTLPATTKNEVITKNDRRGLLESSDSGKCISSAPFKRSFQSNGKQHWNSTNPRGHLLGPKEPKDIDPPPNKLTKLVALSSSLLQEKTSEYDSESGSTSIYILVPVTKRRTSLSSNQSSNSGSDNESNQSFEIMSLVQGGKNKLNEILSNIGMEVDNSNFTKSLNFSKPKPDTFSKRVRKRNFAGSLLCDEPVSLQQLTRQDCEVNAPLNKTSELLQGPEILQALETVLSTESTIL